MSMISVDGKDLKDPSTLSVTLQDISAGSSGRTQLGYMYKNRVAQKYKISVSWNYPTDTETSIIFQAFQPEYFFFSFPDPLSGKQKTIEAYRGDITAPFQMWNINGKIYTKVSFDIIER